MIPIRHIINHNAAREQCHKKGGAAGQRNRGAVVSWLLNIRVVRVVAFVVAAAVTLQFDASCSEACHIVADWRRRRRRRRRLDL